MKIAVFVPLYLDSAFSATGTYVHNNTFPKYLNAGLEFYQGVQLAIDSLDSRGAPLEVYIYDLRSKRNPVSSILNSRAFADIDMIIAESNAAETRMLADAALKKKIPFISTTLPNDVGVSNNPYFVILNSTLQAHIDGIYQLVQRQFSNARIVVFRKNGPQEDLLKKHFTDYAKVTTSNPLNIKYVDLGNDFKAETLAAHLDSTRKNIVISGTLDTKFAIKLAENLASINSTYPVSVIGMPNWESVNFGKNVNNLEIIYSTPFYYTRSSSVERKITDDYQSKMGNTPTDIFYRGFETMLRFGLLLLDSKSDLASNLTRKGNYVISQFDIQPVFKNKSSMTLDYFENKNLYFVRVMNGHKSRLF